MVSDQNLIDDCIAGNRKAYERLYNRYARPMLGVCMRYTRNKAEAEDLLHEGFIKVFKKLNNFKGKGSFEGWIRRIMVNTAITYYHQTIKKEHQFLNNSPVQELAEDMDVDEIQIPAADLLKMVQDLPMGYRMVFNLFAIDGLSHHEIANQLEISVNTSKTQLFKARLKLKEAVAVYLKEVDQPLVVKK